MQSTLLPIYIEQEADSTLGGAELKRVANGDDGHTYAVKRLADHPALPLCEWVGYHLCRAVGIRTPDFAILQYKDGSEPAFGSRIVMGVKEIEKDPKSYQVAAFFQHHLPAVARIYSLDAFFANRDRHGRNFLIAHAPSGSSLLSIDFSQSWVRFGQPFGNTEALRDSETYIWWRHFKRNLNVQPDLTLLERIAQLPDDWLNLVIETAPSSWSRCIDVSATCEYWKTGRTTDRIEFAKLWL